MEVMELVWAITEVSCVIPLRIVVVAKPFHAACELSFKDTGPQNLINLIFDFIIPLGGKSRVGLGARRWSALKLKPRPRLLMKACALEIVILLIYLSFSSL
jgi:hypothetical protein